MDRLNSQKHRANMAAIHSKDTKPEMVMRRYLRGRGLRSQLNHPRLSGEPDIVMREYWTGYHSIAIMTLYLFGNFEQLNLIEEKDMKYTLCPTLLENMNTLGQMVYQKQLFP